MAANGYFQVVAEDGRMWLKIFAPEEGEVDISPEMVMKYLDAISFPDYDQVALDQYLKRKEFDSMFMLYEGEIIPESEKCIVTITPNGERAFARFYPPTTGGASLTEDDIVSDLQMAGVRHGIRKKAIEHFLQNHAYEKDYLIAEATMPVQGYSAKIKYYFDINTTARPKLNEDGSVDFHQLGNIKSVKEGDKLATLTPAYRGKAGVSVLGKPMMPKKVRNRALRFGRNIRISEDKCTIYSKVSGHVTLVDDMVMVSDVYRVPANVDSSTGDIDYKGTVEVTGNVTTGFAVKAEGDIIVNGVVEGATLVSGGNIVLKRGMQGMDRGMLQAEGNITAKFLENCKVRCKGMLKADAILHSDVECQENVDILGKKGLINGGRLSTYADVHATTLGSTMGASTKIKIISDKELIIRANEIKEEVENKEETLRKIDEVVNRVKGQLASNQEVLPEQMNYLKQATVNKPLLVKQIRELREEREKLLVRIEKNKHSCIRVEGAVYSGIDITVKDVSKIQHEQVSHCRFVRDGADVRIVGL